MILPGIVAGISYPPIPITRIGPVDVSLHGFLAGVGFALGAWLMLREVDRRGFDGRKVVKVLAWALIGALVGARLFTVPAHLGDEGYGIGDVLSLSGQDSSLGGYAGGIIAALVAFRHQRLEVLPHFDMAAPSLALGAFFARAGDLAIVEHLGSETSFFLGYTLTPGYQIAPQHAVIQQACDLVGECSTFHHTALYDLIGVAVLFPALLYLRGRWTTRAMGQLFALWALWYGLQRLLIDSARIGAARAGISSDSLIGPLTGSQWGALTIALLGGGLLAYLSLRSHRAGTRPASHH